MNIGLIDTLWSKTKVVENCWLWTGYLNNNKYGILRVRKAKWIVSRLSLCIYLGLEYNDHSWQANHICSNQTCWNPLHLYVGTEKENTQDARRDSKLYNVDFHNIHRSKVCCPKGHPYDYIAPDGSRKCKTCRRETRKRFRR